MDGQPKIPALIEPEPDEELLWCQFVDAQTSLGPIFAV